MTDMLHIILPKTKNALDTANIHPYIDRIVVAHRSIPASRGSSVTSPHTDTPNPLPAPVLDLTDAAAARIIRELAEPTASLDTVAAANGLAVADLALWLTTPAARERMLAIEQGGYTHVRMAASLQLSRAVATLIRVLDTFNALAASRPADDPLVIRAAIHANKSAYHLYRLSRIVPIDETQRARASEGIRAARAFATHVSHAITSPPEPEPQPQSQSQPQPASPLANTAPPIVANDAAPPPQPTTQTPPSHSAAHASDEPRVPTDMSQLLTQLSALATSLGIDISDLDDPGPDLEPHLLLHASSLQTLADTT